MNSPRIVCCSCCDGEGRIQHYTGGLDWGDGSPRGYTEPCPYCDGTGGEIIETEIVTLDDISR
jgi:hypothetical protein